jgi:hypothetical protein
MFENLINKTSSFSSAQLTLFEKELKEAGDFNELMFRKNAFIRKNGSINIVLYNNITEYKEKYLTGEYESLRTIYKTKIPFSFWSKIHIELRKRKGPEYTI